MRVYKRVWKKIDSDIFINSYNALYVKFKYFLEYTHHKESHKSVHMVDLHEEVTVNDLERNELEDVYQNGKGLLLPSTNLRSMDQHGIKSNIHVSSGYCSE